MTVYDYMCDVLHIQSCEDCSNYRNYQCVYDYDYMGARCLAQLGVTREDIINGTSPYDKLRSKIDQLLKNPYQ